MIGRCTVPFRMSFRFKTSVRFRLRLSVALASAVVAILSGQTAFSDPPKGPQRDWRTEWARMKPMVPRGYVCYRATDAPKIDGLLDDAAWQAVPWTEDFRDIEGDRKPQPRFRTRAKMLWDDKYFYIGATLEEPHVWGTLTQHDSVIFNDNDFEVFIDPNGDNLQYYEFEINALNTSWDLFLNRPYKDDGRADNDWNIAGLKTAVHVEGTLNNPSDRDRGWSVEIAIPWEALAEFAHRPAPPRDGDQWRVDFSRVEWQHEIVNGKYRRAPNTHEDNWIWSPPGIVDMHRPERWGYVQFSTAPPNTASFHQDPLLPARDALMEIYYHQRAFQDKHGHFAAKLDELALTPETLAFDPRLRTTGDGFRAGIDTRGVPSATEPKIQTLTIRETSRLRFSDANDDLLDALEDILQKQAAAWNRGDIDAFMEHYWKSDDLTFSSGGKTTRGWQTTKDGYKRRYPTRDQMGRLTFDRLEVFALGDTAALLLGHWRLDRANPVGGNFSLVFRKIDGAWVIVHDHTSQAP